MGIAESSDQLLTKFSEKDKVLHKHETVLIRAAGMDSTL